MSVPRRAWGAEPAEPPRDIPAEQATLGAILLSADTARTLLPLLRPEQFHRPAHGELLAAMQHLQATGDPVDPLTVHAELRRRGRAQFGQLSAAVVLHDLLAATPGAAHGRYYAAIVADTAARRRAVEAGVRLAQLAGSGQGDLDQLMSDVVREVACVRAAVDRHHALATPGRELTPADRPLRAVAELDSGR